MDEVQKLYPGLEPDGEPVVGDARAFVDACMARVSEDATKLGWRLGGSVLRQSDEWVLVFRIDILRPAASSGVVSRYIMWGSADGEILGTAFTAPRNVAPL